MRSYEFESTFDTVNDHWQDEITAYNKKGEIKHSKDRAFKKSFDKSFDKSFKDKSDNSRFKKDDRKDSFKKDTFKNNDKKSFDKRQTGKDRFYDNEPVKSDKPKMRYEKIDGKLVATPINNAQTNQSNQPKKYVLKSKS